MSDGQTIHDAAVDGYARLKFPFQVYSRNRAASEPIAGFREKAVAEAFILQLRAPEAWYLSVPENYAPPPGPGAHED